MRALFSLAGITFLVMLTNAKAGDQDVHKLSFDKGKVGETPPGWKAGIGGKEAKESVWKLVEDKTAPGGPLVLFQTLSNPRPAFNLCLYEGGKFTDIDISLSIKPIGGKGDQGGGIMWRARDFENNYVVRMSPGEDNLWLFKTVKGARVSLQKSDAPCDVGKWHTIRVTHKADKIQCFFDGKSIIELSDKEFTDAGLIGLWTKGDSQTYFSDLKITAKKE